jgi:chaperonin GroES
MTGIRQARFSVREGYSEEPDKDVDIVKVVSERVRLTRRGRNHVGLCPFHEETTPSFHVSRRTGRFYCFGCHKKGTSIDFVLDIAARNGDELDWTDAMRILSDPRYRRKMKMKIRATGDKVFVRRCKAEEVTPGGIIIPDNAQDKPTEGIVVSSGRGRTLQSGAFVENTVKEGDKVLLPSWGAEVEIDGQKLVVVPEESILGVFEKSNEAEEG